MEVVGQSAREQVARVLKSETFRSSEVLRKLLVFLADKSLSGDAGHLKEYTIGIDALGKPPEYDPRHDSVVRMHLGRLRTKLAEYYRSEGKEDPLVIELPKGHFRLQWDERGEDDPARFHHYRTSEAERTVPARTVRILGTALLAAVLWASYSSFRLWRAVSLAPSTSELLGPEIAELWRPMLSGGRPLIIALSSSLRTTGMPYVPASPQLESARRALQDPVSSPMYRSTGYGNLPAVFRLGELVAVTGTEASLIRADRLSWQQLSGHNVIFLGPASLNDEQVHSLSIDMAFELSDKGVRNLHPKQGEPAFLAEHDESFTHGPEGAAGLDEGNVYALITHIPGPNGSGDIACFNSTHNPGTQGAVEAFTTPALAKSIAGKFRNADGRLPRYYQIVLDVKYKDGVPIDTSYVMHRELRAERRKPE